MSRFAVKKIPGLLNQLSQALLLDAHVGDTRDGAVKSLGLLDFIGLAPGRLFWRNGV
jgi:hypothetical protein